MDKIDKKLKILDRKTRDRVLEVFKQLESGKTIGLDIKPLKGSAGILRVRVGGLRIIFERSQTGIEIIDIAYRSEKTYRDL